METDYLGCGCSISRSMFAGREYMRVTPCLAHCANPEIQKQLSILSDIMIRVIDEEENKSNV